MVRSGCLTTSIICLFKVTLKILRGKTSELATSKAHNTFQTFSSLIGIARRCVFDSNTDSMQSHSVTTLYFILWWFPTLHPTQYISTH